MAATWRISGFFFSCSGPADDTKSVNTALGLMLLRNVLLQLSQLSLTIIRLVDIKIYTIYFVVATLDLELRLIWNIG